MIIRETHTASGFVLQAWLRHIFDVCRCVSFYTFRAVALRGIADTEKKQSDDAFVSKVPALQLRLLV